MKLYISDLDGTLLDFKASLAKLTETILNSEIDKGTMFTYATARSIYSAAPILGKLKLNIPVITQNGAFIVNPENGKKIVSHYFSDSTKSFLIDFFKEHNESLLVYSCDDNREYVSWLEGSINKGTRRYISDRKGDKRLHPCKRYEDLFVGNIYYITLISPTLSPAELDNYFDNKNGFARNYQSDTYKTDEYWYEIYRDDVSKANAVTKLKELVGADEVICFGDNVNDISMFRVSDRAYAVSNCAEELKAYATGIIRSNNQSGVAVFIADENSKQWQHEKKQLNTKADNDRFKECIIKSEKELDSNGIGTLNEKQIHSALKSYFSSTEFDKEIKIGSYYADLVTENGIFEIQTRNFKKLIPKLSVFLEASHVTVVYPFHKRTRLNYINSDTGEFIKSGNYINHKDLTDFFIELYRIKQFLNNPNLTICIANLYVENYRHTKSDLKRRKTDTKKTVPTDLENLIYLEDSDSYRYFIPEGLPEIFSKKDMDKFCNFCESSILIEILKYMGVVDFYGKDKGSYLYKIQ